MLLVFKKPKRKEKKKGDINLNTLQMLSNSLTTAPFTLLKHEEKSKSYVVKAARPGLENHCLRQGLSERTMKANDAKTYILSII